MNLGIEAQPLTPPALDFTADDLIAMLQAGDPAERRLERYKGDQCTNIAPVPGRSDLLIRWIDAGYLIWSPDPRLSAIKPDEEHLKPISHHVDIFEQELARLAGIASGEHRIKIPRHATFRVSNDPYRYKSHVDMLYTAVEQRKDAQTFPRRGKVDSEYQLAYEGSRYKAGLAIMGILSDYYLHDTGTGYYLGDHYELEQYTVNGYLLDLDPWLTRQPGRIQALRYLHKNVQAMTATTEQHNLEQRLDAGITSLTLAA